MELKKIVKFLNKELRVKQIEDSSKNGMQIYSGKKDIKKVGVAVDACLDTFEKAKKQKVELLIVHHGLIWRTNKDPVMRKKRIDYLKKNRISLYVAHLPLDCHDKYGNNIGLCRILGLKNLKRFGTYHGIALGYEGRLEKPMSLGEFASFINKKLGTKSQVYVFDKKRAGNVRKVALLSGGGSDAIEEAGVKKADCFVVGEITLSAYHRAKDHKLNMIVAGHYATETLGVQAIGKLLQEKFKLNVVFIENKVDI